MRQALRLSVSDAHRHDDVFEIVVSRNGDQGARVGIAQRALNLAAIQIIAACSDKWPTGVGADLHVTARSAVHRYPDLFYG